MTLPAPVPVASEWRFIPNLQLFADDTPLPVHQGFLLLNGGGFEFRFAFKIRDFVWVCERTRGGKNWFLCAFVENKHITATVIPPKTDMYKSLFEFVKFHVKSNGVDGNFELRPLNQSDVVQQLAAAVAEGFRG